MSASGHDVVTTSGQVLAEIEERLFVGRGSEIGRFRRWLLRRGIQALAREMTSP